ncbi:MAG: SsrA-binding protein [Candidatus Falkowbacteria bacterium]
MPTLAFNKRANFDYEIKEKFETGIMLLGYEVKAVKTGQH